jgi:hypothetical protein
VVHDSSTFLNTAAVFRLVGSAVVAYSAAGSLVVRHGRQSTAQEDRVLLETKGGTRKGGIRKEEKIEKEAERKQ